MEFHKQFAAARRVSTPLVLVRTFDAKSTLDGIRKLIADDNAPIILWDVMNGYRAINDSGEKEIAKIVSEAESNLIGTAVITEALRVAEKCSEDVTIFLSNAHLFWSGNDAAPIVQGIWNLRDGFKANGNMLVLLASPGVNLPAELVNDVLVMDEPLPTVADLEKIVLDTYSNARLDAPNADTLAKATDALIGLPSFPADQSTAMCLDKKTKTLDIPALWERKRQVINQTSGLTVWMGKEKLDDIGGIQSVKTYMSALLEGRDAPKTVIFIDEIEKAFAGTGTDMSGVKTELTGSMLEWMQDTNMAGCILIGVPGVGKSALAKAIGNSYGIPVIKFDLAGMQSSLVGSSGANLRAAQATVNAISAGKVLCIATCNSIGALPPELRSRFKDGVFFFDAPNETERKTIWELHRKKYSIDAADKLPVDIGWTGREIEECCSKAYRLRITLAEASRYIVPVTVSSNDLIDTLRRSSSGKYLSASNPGLYLYDGKAQATSTSNTSSASEGRKMRD